MIFCENCGQQLSEGTKFCDSCGSAINGNATPTCANCNKPLEANQKFCDGCGTAIGGGSAPAHKPAQPAPEPVAINSTTIMAKNFRCSNCGNSLEIPKNARGQVKCPYCKTECVLDGLIKNAEIAAKGNIVGGIPLSATSAQLHRQLVSFLSESPNVTLDVFEKGEVIREERYCIPAYQFNSSGTMKYSYQTGNPVQKQRREKRFDEWYIVTYTEIDWTRANDTADLDAELFVSGNKAVALQIENLYMFLDPGQCEDIEYLSFPNDVVTYEFDIPENKAYSDYVKPHMEEQLARRVRKNIESIKYYKDMAITGSSIRKDDLKRVFLGLYRVVFKYGGEEFSIWVTGDGSRSYWNEGFPEDMTYKNTLSNQKNILDEKKKNLSEKKKTYKSMPTSNKSICIFFLVISIIAAFVFVTHSAYEFMVISLIVSIICIISLPSTSRKGKEREEKRSKFLQEEIKPLESELSNFEEQYKIVEQQSDIAVQQFKSQKKALRGIYEKVSGDESAF